MTLTVGSHDSRYWWLGETPAIVGGVAGSGAGTCGNGSVGPTSGFSESSAPPLLLLPPPVGGGVVVVVTVSVALPLVTLPPAFVTVTVHVDWLSLIVNAGVV